MSASDSRARTSASARVARVILHPRAARAQSPAGRPRPRHSIGRTGRASPRSARAILYCALNSRDAALWWSEMHKGPNDPRQDEEIEVEERQKTAVPRRYKVIFHNDDYTTMEYVV